MKAAKIIDVSEILKKERTDSSGVESLSRWPAVKAAIDAGLPMNGAVELTVTDALAKERGIAGTRTVQRFFKKYLASVGRDYEVIKRRKKDEGVTFYYVANRRRADTRKQA
jgi:hypothetical protein